MSTTWRVLENEFSPGKSWKVKFNVLESHGIYLWFKLTNMPFMYRTPCVNKCTKYCSKLLTEQFLSNLWWTFCDELYSVTQYVTAVCLYITLLRYDKSPVKTFWGSWNIFVSISGNRARDTLATGHLPSLVATTLMLKLLITAITGYG